VKPLLQSETFVRIAAPLAVGVVLFGLWEVGCRLASIPVYLFPKPSDIFQSLVHNGPSLLRALMVTLRVTLQAFAAAVVIGTLVAFIVVCIGVIVLRYTRPDLHRPFRVKGVWFVGGMGVIFCSTMAYSLPNDTWWRLFWWSLLGFVIYFFYSYKHSRLRRGDAGSSQGPATGGASGASANA